MKLYAVLLFVYWFIYHIIVSAMFTFGGGNFHSRRTRNEKPAAKSDARQMESIYGAGFWSVCHGPNVVVDAGNINIASLVFCQSMFRF